MKPTAASLLLAALLARPAFPAELNVIVVVMDTVRADHCSLYGYPRRTTPRLEELAARGLTYETALAQSDWTIPAHASIFTGRRPLSHGVLGPEDRLADGETTLAQLFRRRSFQTAAFTGGAPPLAAGMDRGFDLVRVFSSSEKSAGGSKNSSLNKTIPAAVAWLEGHSKNKFFLFIHGYDAHTPYLCPEPWQRRFAEASAAPNVNTADFSYRYTPGLDPADDWLHASTADLAEARALRSDARNMTSLSDQYDGCLAYGDDQLGTLSDALTRLGLWKNTLVVVTADHGEEFGDHGGYGHIHRPLHDEIARVPLVIDDPRARGSAGRRTDAPFEEIDLLPTIADVEGWPLPAGVEGRSQKAVLDGGALEERIQYSQAEGVGDRKNVDLEALRSGRWKALRDGRRWELFDLSADPRERRDILASKPEIFLELAGKRLDIGTALLPAAEIKNSAKRTDDDELLAREVGSSSDPSQYLPRLALLIQHSRGLPGGGPAARLRGECERAVGSDAREPKPWLLLAQFLSLEGDRPALRRLCESALGRFPEERAFYEYLAGALKTAGEPAALAALKRREMESLPAVLASDYADLAHALILERRPEEARRALADGLQDGRLSNHEKKRLAERAASLDMLWDGIVAGAKDADPAASCGYEETEKTVSVECGGKRLAYDFAAKSWRTAESPAEAARLAGILLERFDQARVAAAKDAKDVLSAESRKDLKAAGYIDR